MPFIARYRKEATGALDDTQLRQLTTRLTYLRELDAERARIRDAIDAQGKLTPALAAQIAAAETKARLGRFEPEAPGVARLTEGLRAKFDPRGLFTPRSMAAA